MVDLFLCQSNVTGFVKCYLTSLGGKETHRNVSQTMTLIGSK